LFYLLDVQRFRLDTGARDARMLATAEADGPEVMIVVPEDPGAAGIAQVRAWMQLLQGFHVKKARPTGSKSVRAGPLSSQVNAGMFRSLPGPWLADYLEELRTFPGTHDDQVDASADAFVQVRARRQGQIITPWD
jgi:predicted phage terminase large subunit-like protein